MHPARLFVLCGLPGSATAARALQLEERFRGVRLPVDDWIEQFGIDVGDRQVRTRIGRVQRDLASAALLAGTNVVVAWGTWARSERDELRVIARRAGALAHLEHLEAPLDALRDRAGGEERGGGSRPIARADLEAWAAIIEPPTADEHRDYDPMPPVRAGERPGGPDFPYGSWRP